MRVQIALCNVALCLGLAPIVLAQDAVKVDPKHYTVMSENDKVRIVKVHYGPGEKSVMHSHPNLVAVFLLEGFHWLLPDNPNRYQFFYDLHILD